MRRMKRSGRKAEILVTVTAAVLLGAVLLLTGCAAREGGAIHPIALEAVQALTEIAAQLAVALIGCTTFLISLGGVYVGNVFGARYKSRAELVGGAILILIGVKVLLEHLLG